MAELEKSIASPDVSPESIAAKEQAIHQLGELYVQNGLADKLVSLVSSLRPFFAVVPKAKTAKIVRMLIDQLSKIPNTLALQMQLCRDSIEWCKAEKRSFLRQRVQARLAALLLEGKMYTDALALLEELLKEVKRLDDKPLLVEINLVESSTHHALRNLAKAKASLTSARTAANAIYCPPLLQAQIDVNAGCLNAEEKDFKTAFSYFYEALENFDSISHPMGINCLKYMLLMKIMMNAPEDVNAIINGKPGMRHQGEGLEAMVAVAQAHKQRSLDEFEAALTKHSEHLSADPIISSHLKSLNDMLLQENICRIIEPYSVVETAHIASVMKLPLAKIEEKLSQMILDKKFRGILDAGAGCLIVYDDQSSDTTYDQALETLSNMSKVVDALSVKANNLALDKPKKEDKEEDKDKKDKKKDGKEGKDDKEKKAKDK
uniref:PCI domain-containing protein n=1 Tax=Haptolina brevifila TaxID=156173 RepID=A0A7S2J8I1_9EUKA